MVSASTTTFSPAMTRRRGDAPNKRVCDPARDPPPEEERMANRDGLLDLDAIAQGELVDAAIARIERLNPTVNAVILRTYERAREAAAGSLGDGPLAGVPYLLK